MTQRFTAAINRILKIGFSRRGQKEGRPSKISVVFLAFQYGPRCLQFFTLGRIHFGVREI